MVEKANSMNYRAINFRKNLSKFSDQWSPKVIAEMNDYQFKLVKVQGDFVWHDHKDTDEVFIVLEVDGYFVVAHPLHLLSTL